MRATRVIYVENDPSLRGILTQILEAQPEIEIVLASGSPQEVLASDLVEVADVALLDLALGAGELNGLDLGIALQKRNPDMGIVIHSQHPLKHVTRRVPTDLDMGWSFLPKTGDMRIEDLVALLRSTAQGHTNLPAEAADATEAAAHLGPDVLQQLTTRQRGVMGLAACGLSAPQIAQRLGVSADSVRQDLSKTYRILVPDADEGDDRRTKAVLTYLRLVQDEAWEQT